MERISLSDPHSRSRGRPTSSLQRSYRRFLIDMHIADWDPVFLSRFDPSAFADAVVSAGGTAAVVSANTHTGLNYWPSAHGRMHASLGERDLLGEMLDALHERGLDAMVYYCLVYVDWYWEQHPGARIVEATGETRKATMLSSGHPRRFSCVCPNNEAYQAFCVGQLAELATGYRFEGVNLDMTFWPAVCYCATCEARHAEELGGSIPRTVDWGDPRWLAFVARRRVWLVEFVDAITGAVSERQPEVAVTHQSQGYVQDWMLGVSDELARRTAWLAADLYRDKRDLSFSFKLFNALSQTRPFEQISGWTWPDIFEHAVMRTDAELAETAALPLANDAAITYIEAIDPDGAIASENYPRVRRIYDRIEQLEPALGGELQQDIGVYISFAASFDRGQTGLPVAELGYAFEPGAPAPAASAHRPAAIRAGETLMRHHLPFGVVTRRHLDRLADWQVIVLPNVALLDDEEVAALHAYVAAGGSLYASGASSLVSPEGVRREGLALGEVLGVRSVGETSGGLVYFAPAGGSALGGFTSRRPLTVHDNALLVATSAAAEVRATLTLPATDPTGARYAAIITDPPWRPTTHPAVVLHRYGRGRSVYVAAPLEAEQHESQRAVFAAFVRDLAPRPLAFEADAPACVEITLFAQPDRGRHVVHLLNVQADTPPVDAHGIRLRVRPGEARIARVLLLPERDDVPWRQLGDAIEIEVPPCPTHLVLALEHEHTNT